jgi:putative membrane protein
VTDEPTSRLREEGAETADEGRLRRWLTVYLKGAAMGAADTVPGVSGGTIALIAGIYERLITAIAALEPRLLAELRGLHTADGRRRIRRRIRELDLPFLIVLGLGAVTSVVALSRFLHAAVVDYPAPTYAFFFGLIAASAAVLYGELSLDGVPTAAGGVVGLSLGFLLAGGGEGGAVEPALPVLFATGAVTISAMVLPGVSGAFILLLLGQYQYLTGVLERLVDATIAAGAGGNTTGLAEGATVVVVFGMGAVVGLLSVARAVRWALDRQRAATLAFLVSLMVGSLRLPVEEVLGATDTWNGPTVGLVLAAIALGAGAVLALDRYTDDLEL